jgi:hypothetical protein
MTAMTARKPAPPPACGAHAVSDAATASPGTGTDTTPSSDWLAERSAEAAPQPGVAISTRPKGAVERARARESRRGRR